MDYVWVTIWVHQLKVEMQCLIWQKLSLNLFQMLPCTCFLKMLWQVEFLTFLRYIANSTTVFEIWWHNKDLKYIIHLEANNSNAYAMSKFLPTSWFKWIDSKDFYSVKYSTTTSKKCVLEVDSSILKNYIN